MAPSRKSLILPILLITFGVGWLLTSWEIATYIDWPWTLGLAASGILLFGVLGVDKVTVVCAPLLLIGSVLSLFYQTDKLSVGVLVPLIVIIAGLLLLVARRPSIPIPRWIVDSPENSAED